MHSENKSETKRERENRAGRQSEAVGVCERDKELALGHVRQW